MIGLFITNGLKFGTGQIELFAKTVFDLNADVFSLLFDSRPGADCFLDRVNDVGVRSIKRSPLKPKWEGGDESEEEMEVRTDLRGFYLAPKRGRLSRFQRSGSHSFCAVPAAARKDNIQLIKSRRA